MSLSRNDLFGFLSADNRYIDGCNAPMTYCNRRVVNMHDDDDVIMLTIVVHVSLNCQISYSP